MLALCFLTFLLGFMWFASEPCFSCNSLIRFVRSRLAFLLYVGLPPFVPDLVLLIVIVLALPFFCVPSLSPVGVLYVRLFVLLSAVPP